MKRFNRAATIAGTSAVLALGGVLTALPAAAAEEGPAATAVTPAAVWGVAWFEPYGEHFYVCDTDADGKGVGADIRWNGTTRHVGDANGSKDGCGHKNYDIAEGTLVQFRLTWDDVPQGSWVDTYA
ncbi:hypothetical protein [Amycolatopsis magusensis]|uniref:Secreted protein n=1 Tax=Amycolatopsis magusensis TaxID=882444 RepID=A0ABS4PQS3_9PSEU|nr:hypothetical protein [Amycolatopsis magusensis]MBP2181772.1 hypothetical protein [Amycolatopsis magusensis]